MRTPSPLPFALAALVATLATPSARADEASEAAAADLLHRRLKNEAPGDAALLAAVKDRDVVVVSGSYDHIESVLKTAKIRHTLIRPSAVAAADLRASQIVMVDCPGTIPRAGVRRLERFVRAGGLLYTTDWALKHVVEVGFPGTIAHNGASTGDEVVPVVLDERRDDLMSSVLLRANTKPQWWLEGGSYPVRVLDPKRVTVLAHSDVMQKRYGAGPIVVRVRWHDGQIIHVVSHFYRQLSTTGPQVAAAKAVEGFQGLSAQDKAELAKGGLGGASAGNVESSYAFQRMTSNLVTGKQKENVALDQAYGSTVAAPVPLAPGPAAPPAPDGLKITPGTKLKVLEKKVDRARVRDDAGNEGWLPATDLIAR